MRISNKCCLVHLRVLFCWSSPKDTKPYEIHASISPWVHKRFFPGHMCENPQSVLQDIEGSTSNVPMNARLPRAPSPSTTLNRLIGRAYAVCNRTGTRKATRCSALHDRMGSPFLGMLTLGHQRPQLKTLPGQHAASCDFGFTLSTVVLEIQKLPKRPLLVHTSTAFWLARCMFGVKPLSRSRLRERSKVNCGSPPLSTSKAFPIPKMTCPKGATWIGE